MQEDLNNKYDEQYFNHWLAMFEVNQEDWSPGSVENQIALYKEMESEEGFKGLQNELKLIIENNDIHAFMSTIDMEFSEEEILKMADMILSAV